MFFESILGSNYLYHMPPRNSCRVYFAEAFVFLSTVSDSARVCGSSCVLFIAKDCSLLVSLLFRHSTTNLSRNIRTFCTIILNSNGFIF